MMTIGNGVTSFGSYVFDDCARLTSVTIGGTYIPDKMFSGLDNLTNVTIGDKVTSIGDEAFSDCDSLASVAIGNGVISFGNYVFDNCENLTSVTIGGTYIPDKMFSGLDNLTNVTIGDKVTAIGNSAFYWCRSLTSVTIGNGVVSIGDKAFEECSKLTGVDIPDSVTSIGGSAFYNCISLTSVDIPDSVTSIGDYAFRSCSSLTSVDIPDSVTSIGGSAFYNCTSLTSVTMGDGTTSIGSSAFSGCNSLTSIHIPDSVTSIGDSAFSSCDSLASVTIGNGVTSIGKNAFYWCDNLTDVYYGGSETEWAAISIGSSNEGLTGATIHYNSTGPDDPGTGSEISYVAGILKSYDSQTQELFFEYYDGITEVYEYKVTDQTEVENWDTLIGNPVLVSYIPGEYGTGTLSRYVIKVQPAETKVGIVNAVTNSTITLNGEVFNQNLGDFFGLDYYVGQTVVCYWDDGAVVALNALEKKTGILNAGSNTSVTIDGVQYAAILDGIPPYLSAPELWFEQEVEYYSYSDGANRIICEVSLKPYSSTFTKKLTKWEGTTVTFEDGTIRQTTQDVVFDVTLIGKWVDCTIGTTADGGNVIMSIELAKPTYRTEVKKMIAWNDGNPQFSDGTTMGVFLVGDQYDPVMIGRWVELTIADDLNTGTKITGISLAVPSSKSDFQLVHSTDIYLKGNQYSFDGQNYEDSSKFEIEFKIFIQNIVENVSDINLPEMKKDTSMNLTVEDIQITAPDGFNFDWFGSGAVDGGKGLAVPAGEAREVTGFIRPGMLYFVDEKEVTETIACKIVLSNGDVFEKKLSFTIHNLDYEEPSTGDDDSKEIEQLSKDAANELADINLDEVIWLADDNFLRNDLGLSSESINALRKSLLINLTMCTLPEKLPSEIISEKLFDKYFSQYKLQFSVPNQKVRFYYIFDTPQYGKLTIAIDCNLSNVIVKDQEFAMYGFLNYTVLNQEKNPPTSFPDYKKHGEFGMVMQYDISKFANAAYELAEAEIKQYIYDPTVGKPVSSLADIVLSETTKKILKALGTSPEKMLWELITRTTKSTRAACPIDVYVYDSNGNLCGAIENNVITKQDPDNFELRVEGDVKYVLGLEDGYKIEYVATDNGTMDVEITEEIGYNRPFRKIFFNDIVLTNNSTYSQNTPSGVLSDISEYTIVSSVDGSHTSTILADSEEFLLDLGSDNTEEPDGGVTGDNGESDNDSENNGGDTSSDTNSDNDTHSGGGVNVSTTYAITVKGTNNGTITCSPSRAVHGNNVLITVKSDPGYELSELLVTDKNGNSISLVKKNETQYTFIMPASKVTVSAIFTEIVVEPEPIVLPFDDISQSAWYYGAVEYVYSNDMMQGTSTTTFLPEVEMSRGMIATVLYRLANAPTLTGSIPFSDVGGNEWYTDAIQWAAENNIMSGYGNNRFGPMDSVTREQLAVILYNYTVSKGNSVEVAGDLSVFRDAEDTSDWAEETISWAVGVGLLSGKGNGILDPTGTATRAEVAQILMNYCTKVA